MKTAKARRKIMTRPEIIAKLEIMGRRRTTERGDMKKTANLSTRKMTRKQAAARKEKSARPAQAVAAGMSKIEARAIKVLGIGGIGSSLVSYLGRFLWSQNAKSFNVGIDLIDGDSYEFKNKARMPLPVFEDFTNKAVAKAVELAQEFGDRLRVTPIPEYVTEKNIKTVVRNGDVVFMAVDNYKTRKLVSEHCEKLKDVVLFSGGNDGVEDGQDGTVGNVQIYEKRNGKRLKNPMTRFHPEIENPADKAPFEMSCEELAQSSAPQLLFTNLAVASAMLNAFYSWLHHELEYEEAYLDIVAGRVQPSQRELAR